MRNRSNSDYSLTMAMLVTDSDRPSPKVWQPWYIDEADGVRKELPTRVMREHRMKERMALQKSTNRRTLSPLESSDDEEIDVGAPPSSHSGSYSYAYFVESFDENTPLDMSTKRRSPPPAHTPTPPLHPPLHAYSHAHTPPPNYLPPMQLPPPPAHTPNSSSPPPYVPRAVYPSTAARGRPTVITCATPIYLPPFSPTQQEPPAGSERPYAHAANPPPSYPDRFAPPPPYNVAAAQLREKLMVVSNAESSLPTPPEMSRSLSEGGSEEAKRHVVQAGPVDPEIDEHFRRSLGRNYQELFITENSPENQPESSDSVDDHFAKALGDTWTQLKAKRRNRGGSSLLTKAANNAAPYHRGRHVSPLRTSSTPPSLTPVTLSRVPPPSHTIVSANRSSPSSETLIIQGCNEVSITRVPTSYCSSSGSESYPEMPLQLTSKVTPT